MRLIDADKLMEHVWRDKLDSRELIAKMVDNAPTETVTEFADRCKECGARYGKMLKQKSDEWMPLPKRYKPETIEVTRCDEKIIYAIDFAIEATDSQDDYSMGMRNGMRYTKSLIDGKEPQYELRKTNEEKKILIDIGDEVVDDHGTKGIVVGIDTYKGEVMLSLLMKNHKVPQLVEASMYKTKTGRYFPEIMDLLEQIG